MKFRKKPVVIDAVQWTGSNGEEIDSFIGEIGDRHYYDVDGTLIIKTLEGNHDATINDWIIKGIKGEFYPCKPDIFEMTYEKEKERPAIWDKFDKLIDQRVLMVSDKDFEELYKTLDPSSKAMVNSIGFSTVRYDEHLYNVLCYKNYAIIKASDFIKNNE
jgi:hypothetical protein